LNKKGKLKKKIVEENMMGIDPGTKEMGVTILWNEYDLDKKKEFTNYYWELLKFKNEKIMEFLENMAHAVDYRCCEYNIDTIIIEKMFMAYNNRNSSLLNLIPQVIKEIVPEDVKIIEIGSKTVKKKLYGSGNATKEQVRKEVNKRLGLKIKDYNISDAFALLL